MPITPTLRMLVVTTVVLGGARLATAGEPTGVAKIEATAALGEQLWHASCPVHEIDGACVVFAPAPASALANAPITRCGADSKPEAVSVPRDAGKLADALAKLGEVVQQFDARAPGTDDPELRRAAAVALLIEGDAQREAALALAFPRVLDGNALGTWLTARSAAAARANATYARVFAEQDAKTSVAAAARLGQIAEDLGDALVGAEIPRSIRTGPLAMRTATSSRRWRARCSTPRSLATRPASRRRPSWRRSPNGRRCARPSSASSRRASFRRPTSAAAASTGTSTSTWRCSASAPRSPRTPRTSMRGAAPAS
jgi:hypothetical protein